MNLFGKDVEFSAFAALDQILPISSAIIASTNSFRGKRHVLYYQFKRRKIPPNIYDYQETRTENKQIITIVITIIIIAASIFFITTILVIFVFVVIIIIIFDISATSALIANSTTSTLAVHCQ